AIWIVCAAGIALYLFGLIRFPHDSPLRKLSPVRIGFGSLAVLATIYLATGFRISERTNLYTSLKALSGYAPPVSYNFFRPDMEETDLDPAIKAKYSSFSKCANNLDCFKDYYEGIAYAKETDKPVLLDFTGKACVNCRKTEEHIWVEDQVWKKINDDFVLISLYADDKKKLDKVYKSKNTDKKLRNIGNKWSDFQIVNFNQNSQPLYVMMTAEEEVLAKPRGYDPDVNEYAEFLECGLNTFKAINQQQLGSK
ncbi:MAG: thioredoxin family protein, partial [Bacteroidota bacterium]